jgi:osmoprotectant transport system permease protein
VSFVAVAAHDPWIRWDWVRDHTGVIGAALRQHVELTAIAVVIGLLIALPVAITVRRWARFEAPVLAVAGVIYTVPSLALFALLIPWTGLSQTTSEIGLVGYTLLILIRNAVEGMRGVAPEVRDAAAGMGFSPWAQLLRVELPLAVPAIVAGIRIATVTTIGLVTITALIGQGGLGQFILDGFQRDFRTPLVVGAVLSVALAALADGVLLAVERAVTPWARGRR